MSFGCSYRKVVHNLSTVLFRFYNTSWCYALFRVPFSFELFHPSKNGTFFWLETFRFMINVLFILLHILLLPENQIPIQAKLSEYSRHKVSNFHFKAVSFIYWICIKTILISSAFKLFVSNFLYLTSRWMTKKKEKQRDRMRERTPSRWMDDAMNMITFETLTTFTWLVLMKWSLAF